MRLAHGETDRQRRHGRRRRRGLVVEQVAGGVRHDEERLGEGRLSSRRQLKLEFRIRPFATVFLDGKALGQTPFAPVQVPVGTHTVRLINRELGKDITRTIEVKAGQSNIVKQDLHAD